VGIGSNPDRVYGQYLLSSGAGAGHFQDIMGDIRLYTLQLPHIIRVKSGNNLTNALRFGIRTAEENAEARADKESGHTDYQNHRNGNPAAGSNGGNQRLCSGYNCLDRKGYGFGNRFCGNYGSFGGGTSSVSRLSLWPAPSFGRLLLPAVWF